MKTRKIVVGLTGGFGTGKSTVARLFRAHGAAVLDADRIAHACYAPGKPLYRRIVRAFGKGILRRDRAIDRRLLAERVFGSPRALARLNRLVHPEVIRQIRTRIRDARQRIVVVDAPLLVEAGLTSLVDALIVVTCTRQQQIARAVKKTGLGRRAVIERIKAQIPLSRKKRLADFIIDNSGSWTGTKRQVENIRRNLWKS